MPVAELRLPGRGKALVLALVDGTYLSSATGAHPDGEAMLFNVNRALPSVISMILPYLKSISKSET
jgi:hypothetical protein